MPNVIASANVKEASIHAVVIRADGTREVIGTVAFYHRNPLRRLWWNVKQLFKR